MKNISNLKSRKILDKLFQFIFLFNGILVIAVVSLIFILLLKTSLPAFDEISIIEFLTSTIWNPDGYDGEFYGIVSMVVSTCYVTAGAMLIAVPIGIGCAAYLSEIASNKTREIIKPIIELLAGVPSVVIGFLGIVFLGPIIAKTFNIPNGLNAINGSILLAIMALPTIISLSEDALNNIPESYEHASFALGATKWQTIYKVKIPAAISGIIASCILGMGRAIGETMTVLMATGCAPAMPESILGPVRTLTSTIAIELGEVAYDTTHYYSLYAVGLVLFIITFCINMFTDVIINRHERQHK